MIQLIKLNKKANDLQMISIKIRIESKRNLIESNYRSPDLLSFKPFAFLFNLVSIKKATMKKLKKLVFVSLVNSKLQKLFILQKLFHK
jgi:hypothetical protein